MEFFEEIRGKKLAPGTKKSYERRQNQLIRWLEDNYSVLCGERSIWNVLGLKCSANFSGKAQLKTTVKLIVE